MWGEIFLGEVRLWVVGAGRLNKRRISDFGGFRILFCTLWYCMVRYVLSIFMIDFLEIRLAVENTNRIPMCPTCSDP